MIHIIQNASVEDADQIFEIINDYSEDGIILKRTKSDITNSIDTFLVARIEDKIAGLVSYYDYGRSLKEIRSLSTLKEMTGKGIGSDLLHSMVQKILKSGDTRIFVLTYNPGFFIKHGFIEIDKDSLPEKIWKDCINCANLDDCGETALIYSANR